MDNKLAEAINTVRGALAEIERREKAADLHVAERKRVVEELENEIAALTTEKSALEKSVVDARKATQVKLIALQQATATVLKGL